MKARDFLVVLIVIAALAAFLGRRPPSTPEALSSTPYVHPGPYSIQGVRLNATGTEVEALLGKPTSTAEGRWNYKKPGLSLTMSFLYDHISSVQCSRGAVFAKNGKTVVLIGQTREQVLALFGPPTESSKTSVQYRGEKSVLTIHFRRGKVSEMGIFDDRTTMELRPAP